MGLLDRFQPQSPAPQDTEQPIEPGTLSARMSGTDEDQGVNFEDQLQPLPDGAKGYDPFGNPVFGEKISDILKKWKFNFLKDVQEVTDDEWNDLKDRWKASLEKQSQVSDKNLAISTQEESQVNREQMKLAGETISKAWQAGSSEGSLLAPVLKFTSATLVGIGDLFSIPAKKLEQAGGAAIGFQRAANMVESPLPRLDENLLTKGIENLPLGTVYDFARLALSPSENKWDIAQREIENGWNAGRILYSQMLDASLKEKYLQQYREGKDPALIAAQLENPLAEVAGQAIIDPLNLVGAFLKGAKTARELEAATEAVTASGLLKTEKGKLALKAIQEAADDQSGAHALQQLVEAQQDAVKAVTTSSKVLNASFTRGGLTTTSRQNAAISKGKTMLGNMALVLKQQGVGYDGIAEAILAGVRSVASNADEMRAGLAALSKLPNANMWLADDYIESFTLLNRMMSNADGVIDGSRLKALTKVKDPVQFADRAAALLVGAARSDFADVGDLENAYKVAKKAEKIGGEAVENLTEKTRLMAEQYKNLPPHVKALTRMNNAIEVVAGPINRILFPAYFNLQGGVAARNVLNNQELILFDKGIGAWFKDGKYWSAEGVKNYITDIYGVLPESTHGFKSLVSAATDRPAWGFGKWMEAGEESAATRIVGASIRDTFDKMLPKAMPDLAKEIEAGVLTERQSKMLLSLVKKNHLDVRAALSDFREMYKVGHVEDWRNLDFVSEYERQGLESLGYWDDIQDFAHTGAGSKDDVEALFAKLNNSIDARSELATGDMIGLSPDHPGVDSWGDLLKAADEGHLDPKDQQLFTAIMESAEQARLEYQNLLDDVALKATQALNLEGKSQEALKIGQEMNRVRNVLRRSGPATAKAAHEITQDAWRWTEEIKGIKKITPEQLAAYWEKAGLTGDVPLDLDKKRLLGELWGQRFDKVSDLWNSSFDAIVGESETVLKQMESVIDTAELKSMATRTRYVTQQAQAIRQGVFEKGALKLIPKKDLEFVAKQYGISVDEIINTINNQKGTAYQTFDDVPTNDILKVLRHAYDEQKAAQTTVSAAQPATKAAQVVTMEKAKTIPVHELPPVVEERFQQTAKRMLDDLTAGQPGKRLRSQGLKGGETVSQGTTNIHWYRELYAEKKVGKPALIKALEKIIEDGGKDKGVNVERMKELILDTFRYGDEATGTPPDLYMLQQLGVPDNVMREALGTYNDITKQSLTLEQAIMDVTPSSELLHNPNMPYFDDAGNLIDPNEVKIPPPHPIGTTPTAARAWNESSRGAKYVLDNIKTEILNRWGKTNTEVVPSAQMDAALEKIAGTLEPRIGEIKAIALRYAEQERNFALLNYGEKTYGDIALARILPFHFWYNRSYKNWVMRLANSPQFISHYAQFRDFLEKENANLPDWYKHQFNINPLANNPKFDDVSFLGIPLNHPLYSNLEATFNPLYGLTGTDYNDRIKRNNWATATIDDMGKFGPTLYAPIQLGIAAMLFQQGETDVAARWAGRLFPETVQVKALTSTLLGKPIELDPAVRFFSNGIDPQERGRMSYAAAQLINSGQFAPEQVLSDFQAQRGLAWDASYQMAVQSRAASAFTSYFLGVGFKPRSQNDVMVENMYTDLNKLYAAADLMDSETYRRAWEQLRGKYPEGFVDAVLLSRKGGDKRDAALAYEVLNRLPPGKVDDALTSIGLSYDEISKFHETKGFTSKEVKFTKQEKDRFMAAVMDLSAMLKIPDSATAKEWTLAKTTYSTVYKRIEEELGDDIWDKVSLYYDLKDDDYYRGIEFGRLHPEVYEAQQMKRAAVINDPVLSAYYGGIETIEMYLDGQMRQYLSDKYGASIYDIQSGYYNSDTPRTYLAAHPELKRFWTEKHAIEAENEKAFYDLARKLPQGKSAQFREDFTPESTTQQTLFEQLQQQPAIPAWSEVSQGMPDWLQHEIAGYAINGTGLSNRAEKELDYLADVGDYYNADSLLQLAVLSMTQPIESEQQGSGLLGRFQP